MEILSTRLQSQKLNEKKKNGLKDSCTAISYEKIIEYVKDIFYECTKNEVLKYSKRMPSNIEKNLNAKDKCICYF